MSKLTRRDFAKIATVGLITAVHGPADGGLVRSLLGVRGAFSGGGAAPSGPSASDYVQSGLLSMWDGIENAGFGVPHDSGATSWMDLARGTSEMSGISFNANGAKVSGNGLVEFGSSGNNNYFIDILGADYTVECVLFVESVNSDITNTNGRIGPVLMNPGSSFTFGQPWNTPFYVWPYGFGNYAYNAGDFRGKSINLSAVYAASGTSRFYRDGADTGATASSYPYQNKFYQPSIGGTFTGLYHSIRVYNRQLTAAEVAANYAVDKARFGLS